MIAIKSEELFDLNKIGLYVTLLIAILILFNPMKLIYLIILEMVLCAFGYFLYDCVNRNKHTSVMINNQDKWFVSSNDELSPVEIKDFWMLKQYLFIWVNGAEKSVSFVVTRSIIGEHKFSQLLAKIK